MVCSPEQKFTRLASTCTLLQSVILFIDPTTMLDTAKPHVNWEAIFGNNICCLQHFPVVLILFFSLQMGDSIDPDGVTLQVIFKNSFIPELLTNYLFKPLFH